MDTLKDFNFSITSVKSNYGDIFSFLNKLLFDDDSICKGFLIREQKIIIVRPTC